MRDLLGLEFSDSKQLSVLNTKKSKSAGTLYIQDSSIKPIFSYMDYKIHRNVNIGPIIVIDYSLSNLTFDDSKCIHTLKPGA
jgi:hypothetical protein